MSTDSNPLALLEVLVLFRPGVNTTVATIHNRLRKNVSLLTTTDKSVSRFIWNMERKGLLVVTLNPKRPIRERKYKITPKGISLKKQLAKSIRHPNKRKKNSIKIKKEVNKMPFSWNLAWK